MNSGIYKITNRGNSKVYIGSTVDFAIRWRKHRDELSRGIHPNRYLQNAWNKSGAEVFTFEIVEEVEPDKLLEREQFYLDQLFDEGNHYNICPAAGNHFGAKRSSESRERLSEAAKRKTASLEALEKNRPKLKGRKLSNETRSKMSEALKRRWTDPEQRAKMTEAQKGKKMSSDAVAKSAANRRGWKHTEEAKAEMSRTRKGRKMSEETKAKKSAALQGKPLSAEHKAKIAAAVKAAKAAKRKDN